MSRPSHGCKAAIEQHDGRRDREKEMLVGEQWANRPAGGSVTTTQEAAQIGVGGGPPMSGQGRRKQRTESQHFVPQFYLRGFADLSERMFCYDKVAARSHPTSVSAAAQERYFYEIPPGSFENVNV